MRPGGVAAESPAMSLRLSALCQSPVSEGMTAAAAVHHTVRLAQRCDELGYHRFWVAEHHADAALASGAPEVLVSHIAALTKRIRVGSGGVLIPFHSPFHVAEQFNLLSALAPGRIDLGIGRSGGSEGQAPAALGVRNLRPFEAVDELLTWLGQGTSERPYANTFATPPTRAPQPWILGTSPASARFAAERGLPYAFGGFLDPRALVPSLTAYHQHFRAGWMPSPQVILGWYVQAAETTDRATDLLSSSELWFVRSFLRGQNAPFPDPETARQARLSPMEHAAIQMRREHALTGTGTEVLAGLEELQRRFAVDEFMLVTIAHDPAARVRSYELIAGAQG
jgi:luciferase family oxidoreductase group 1